MTHATAALPATRPAVLRAVALALLAYATFSAMDTLVKLLAQSFHPVQIACLVAWGGTLPGLLSALLCREPQRLRARAPRLQLVRGLLMLVGGVAAFVGYALLPLADAYAIGFTQPLIVTAASVVILGERVGWRRWTAIFVGFLGVLILLRPGAGVIGLGAVAALVNAFCNGLGNVLLRRGGATDTAEAFSFYGNLTIALGTLPAMYWLWVMPTLGQGLLFLVAGLLVGTAFLVLAHAYRMTPAGVLAPFQYSQMPYAILVGILVFGDLPDPLMLVGAAIIIGSGLYILHREQRRPGEGG